MKVLQVDHLASGFNLRYNAMILSATYPLRSILANLFLAFNTG
jgi:hypothetical protein